MRLRHLSIALALTSGCQKDAPSPDASQGIATHDPNIRAFDSSDPEMRLAMEQARRMVPVFLAHLARPSKTQTFISAKVRLVDGDAVEHIWLDSVQFDGHFIHGRLNDSAVVVHNVRMGQLVSVLPSEISDWMIIDDGRLCGGWTVRVHDRRESGADKARLVHDSSLIHIPADTATCAPAS